MARGFLLSKIYFRIILKYFFIFYRVGGPLAHEHNYRLCATICPIYIMGISVIVLLYEKIQIYGLDNF